MINDFWQRLARNRLLDVGAVVISLVFLVGLCRLVPSRAKQDDFAHYYLSGRLLLEGKNPYTVDLIPLYAPNGFTLPPGISTIRTPNPPLFVWLFTAIARLAPAPGFACWVAAEIFCLVLILWETCWLLGDRLTKRGRLFVCAVALVSAPVYWHFIYSQMGLLLAALVLAAYVWHVQGKHTLACVAVAIAGLLKIYPFVLLPWFLWRSEGPLPQKTVRAATTGAVVLILILLTGVPLWMDYDRYILPQLPGESMGTYNVSLAAYVAKIGVSAAGVSYNNAEAARNWITTGMCVGLVLIAFCYIICWKDGQDQEAEFCLLTLAMLLGSIRTWVHGLVFLIFPVAVLAVRIARRPSWGGIALLTIILFLLNDVVTRAGPFLDQHPLLKISLNDSPLYALLAAGAFFAWQLRGIGRQVGLTNRQPVTN